MNRCRRICRFGVGLLLAVVPPVAHPIARALLPALLPESALYAEDRRPDVFVFHGIYSETDLLPIVLRTHTDYRPSLITVFGWNQPLNTHLRSLAFEAEGQVGLHGGIMKHSEANGLLVARLPFGEAPFSLALGEGISVASANPALENKQKGLVIGDTSFNLYESYYLVQQPNFPLYLAAIQANPQESRPILNYLMVEAEMRFSASAWSPGVFMRVHHRSGVFGLYCPPDPACGSNFVTYGVKLRLP